MSIFPEDVEMDIIIAETVQEDTELPLFKEYAWDYGNNDFIYLNGKTLIVEGAEAIKVWVYKTLKTPRYKYMAYTWDYGHELEILIGQKYSKEFVRSEVERNLKDCLLINPYINDLSNINSSIEKNKLLIGFTVNTIYGEVKISV